MAPDMIFRGEEGQEVEEFIRQVRAHAFEKGKLRDDRWVAEYTSTLVSGSALLWYENLDDTTQQSWDKLKDRLLLEYGRGAGHQYAPEDQAGAKKPPPGPRRGRIAIIDDKLSAPHWVGNKPGAESLQLFQGSFYGTTNPADALVVTVVEENRKPQELLLRMDNGNHLGIKFYAKDLVNMQHSPQHFAVIVAGDLDGNSPYTITTRWEGSTIVPGWQISSDGTLSFNVPVQEGYHPLISSICTEYSVSPGTAFVEYVAAPTEYFQKYGVASGWRRCRLAFEQFP